MSVYDSRRRGLLIAAVGAGLGTLIPSVAAQQEDKNGTAWARWAGEIHERAVARLREILGKDAPNTKEGLHKLVDFLQKLDLINEAEAKLLHDLVEGIYRDADIDKIEKEIVSIFE